ncbi:hypothetical protein DICSQDRAFT_135222 [Dichomitus squalens LYAD-421 SS1]|uniref:uncharacterized protein n=1 Tax=Dichomitus squalens (strain LYAD-421) TaxID=732165 RepID=UPI0004414D7A|nr:uncharacterized protein DICSQDRAFT_135222 [Dichomitus squalens LYAD-421 SS1]EJF62966.1 hypothetical protein DICSQDRAFT_135222 [Dichomitus squalens LYAD-421 SS1]
MPDERDRSVSQDIETDEAPSPADTNDNSASTPAVGKPGRKKNPNSQAARRDQNRIAQREFRLRKQQRIRDLEASVEILSGGKDEALSQLRKVLKDLMHENQVLRGLLKSLSSFIGEGTGGILAKVGWELAEYNDLINKAETDTAWESYQRHKRDKSETTAGPSGSGAGKRPADDSDPYGLRPKRARPDTNGDASRSSDNFPLLVPLNPAASSMGPNGLYTTDYGRGPSNASPMFVPPSSSPVNHSGQYGSPPSGGMSMSFQSSYGLSMSNDPMSTMSAVNNSSMASMTAPSRTSSAAQPSPRQGQNDDEEIDPKKLDAYKLIHYHLDNWKRNNNYCLPSSLRPTLVQRTIPHESVIDGVLHPELRDRMILLRERFNLVDCLHDYRLAVTIHGDDVLAHQNWEISDTWLQRYKFLVDPATLNITNKWRRERGDPELHVGEYSTEPPNQV